MSKYKFMEDSLSRKKLSFMAEMAGQPILGKMRSPEGNFIRKVNILKSAWLECRLERWHRVRLQREARGTHKELPCYATTDMRCTL